MTSASNLADSGPYTGSEKLVIAFDIGTYSSAVAIAHLEPAVVPKLRTVSSWPNSEKELKVRSAVFYSKKNEPKAFAAEIYDEFIQVQAREEGWIMVESFKLLLHAEDGPHSSPHSDSGAAAMLPPLPPGLSVETVYQDFLSYIWKNTKSWYIENTPDGDAVWDKLAAKATIVFATPDGWNDAQQILIKKVLIKAGILSASDPDGATSCLHFLHESEASVHWCLENSNLSWLTTGTAFTIVDAGGSTVDSSLYVADFVTPKLKLRNFKASDCVQTGGVFMTIEGKALITEKLHRGTRFCSPDDIEALTAEFETKAKRKFTGAENKVMLKFGSMADSEPVSGVVQGRLILDGKEVETRCFVDVSDAIIACAKRQTRAGDIRSKHVLLVGGVGESPYIKSKLRAALDVDGVKVVTGDEPTKKAVAEGAIIWFVKQLVVARAVRSTIGIKIAYHYDRKNRDHRQRSTFIDADKSIKIDGGFSALILKDAIVNTAHFTSQSYYRLYSSIPELKQLFSVDLFAFHGDNSAGEWLLDPYGDTIAGFTKIGTVKADLSLLADEVQPCTAPGGSRYYSVHFDVGISFGTNTLFAKILWMEKGQQREGPATIVPVSFQSRA
ncbi:hypothetical protein P7C70_g4284, partial [Phenoliferia sp. Uapishka_3]